MSEPGILQATRINIGGERFQIQTDLRQDELDALVAYVESKMQEHSSSSSRVDPRKQLILISMEITAELFAARQRIQELERSQERASEVAERLLQVLAREVEEVSTGRPRLQPDLDPVEAARVFLSPQ